MATSHTQTKTAHAGSVTSVAVSLTGVASGAHLTAFTLAWQSSNPTILAPTSTPSATWQSALAGFSDSSHDTMAIDYTESAASGSWTVNCRTNAAAFINGIVGEASGVATSASIGSVNHSSGSGNVTSVQAGSITPAVGDIVWAVVMDSSGLTGPSTINLGYSVSSDPAGGAGTAWDGGATVRGGVAHLDNVAASATNPTWTIPSGNAVMSAAIVSFKAAAGGGGVTGTAAVAWPQWVPAATGAETFAGTAAPIWPQWIESAAGWAQVTGPAAATWPQWLVAAAGNTGAAGVTGIGAVSWPQWAVAAAGAETFSGAAAVTLPPWGVAAAGLETFSGAAAVAWPKWTAAATGVYTSPGTVAGPAAVQLPAWSVAAAGQVVNPEVPTEPLVIVPYPMSIPGRAVSSLGAPAIGVHVVQSGLESPLEVGSARSS